MTETTRTDADLAPVRTRAERDAYLSQRDELASAIEAHRYHHPLPAHPADVELWRAYDYVLNAG
jgi:hypothetical protein